MKIILQLFLISLLPYLPSVMAEVERNESVEVLWDTERYYGNLPAPFGKTVLSLSLLDDENVSNVHIKTINGELNVNLDDVNDIVNPSRPEIIYSKDNILDGHLLSFDVLFEFGAPVKKYLSNSPNCEDDCYVWVRPILKLSVERNMSYALFVDRESGGVDFTKQ